MKHHTEKPAADGMKYFTRDLYLRFNSADDAIADQANEDSEQALAEYGQYLDRVRERLPHEVEKLANLCLHDGYLLALEERFEPLGWADGRDGGSGGFGGGPPGLPPWSAMAVISVRQGLEVTVLIYFLWDRIQRHAPPSEWPFSEEKHWLYEELDAGPVLRGPFMHRILWSDGEVTEIPFAAVSIQKFNLSEHKTKRRSRNPA